MLKLWLMEVLNISQKVQFIKWQQQLWGGYNGWTYWHCNSNGSTVVIDSLRQKFITETKA